MIQRRYLIGFTLIEMVVVIVVLGILIAVGANFITLPLKAHQAIRTHAELIDEADSVLTLMVREIRKIRNASDMSLPTSTSLILTLRVVL